MKRRQFIQYAGAASLTSAAALSGCATVGGNQPKVVVIGGGYAGATAAKYTRMWSEGKIDVTLIEPNDAFVSCPISNLVIGGHKTLQDITTPYDNLGKRHGVRLVKGMVDAIGLTVGRQGLISDDAAENKDARVIRVLVALDPASSPLAARYTNLEVVARIDTAPPQAAP